MLQFLIEIPVLNANSVDPDQTPHSVCQCPFNEMSGIHVNGLMYITKTCLYNFDPLKPHFYIVNLGFTGVYIIFLIPAQKHRLWVLVRTAPRF